MQKDEAQKILIKAGMSQARVDAFFAWNALNPQAWRLFEIEMCERMKTPGRLSSKAAFEAIRMKMSGPGKVALNNNHHAVFARLFAAKWKCADRFEFRRMGGFDFTKGEDRYAA